MLQAWEAAGFCCTKQPEAGRPPARHCTDLVCTPPPQLAVHCEKHKQQSPWAAGSSGHPLSPDPPPPPGSFQWSPPTTGGGCLTRFWTFPRYGHWGEEPASLNVLIIKGLDGHEKAAHIWGHRLWSFVECRHQASLSAAPGREMTSQLPPRQSDTEPLPDWSKGTLVPFKSPGGVTGTLPGAFPDMEATAHSSGPIWDPLRTRKWEGTWAIRQTEELKPPNPQQLICPQRK